MMLDLYSPTFGEVGFSETVPRKKGNFLGRGVATGELGQGGNVDLSTVAQLAAAASNVALTVVFAIGYYVIIKQNREMLQQNQQVLSEMRISRAARGRPQIIVEADYTYLPQVYVLVRNVGGGSAQNIGFEFSAPLVSSTGLTLSELSFFKHGMDFLESGEELRSLWDDFNDLVGVLRESGLQDGVTVTVRYRDLAGGSYEDTWNINPLLYEEEPVGVGGHKGMSDLVEAVEKLSADVERISRSDDASVQGSRAETSWEQAKPGRDDEDES